MLAFSDIRSYAAPEERFTHCLYCGRGLYVLSNDRRGGACFDCLSLLGPEATRCSECGAEIAPAQREGGCPSCSRLPAA
jgi:uncharacterized protein with PIN domain